MDRIDDLILNADYTYVSGIETEKEMLVARMAVEVTPQKYRYLVKYCQSQSDKYRYNIEAYIGKWLHQIQDDLKICPVHLEVKIAEDFNQGFSVVCSFPDDSKVQFVFTFKKGQVAKQESI